MAEAFSDKETSIELKSVIATNSFVANLVAIILPDRIDSSQGTTIKKAMGENTYHKRVWKDILKMPKNNWLTSSKTDKNPISMAATVIASLNPDILLSPIIWKKEGFSS